MSFATKLRLLRARHGITQDRLAQQIGLQSDHSRSYIAHLESRTQRRERDTMSVLVGIKIARLFDVSCDYLLRDLIPAEPAPPSRLLPLPDSVTIHKLGSKIRYQRRRLGWSQRKLQEEVRRTPGETISIGRLSQLENSEPDSEATLPSIYLAVRLADSLGVLLDYLLDDRIPVEVPPLPMASAEAPEQAL